MGDRVHPMTSRTNKPGVPTRGFFLDPLLPVGGLSDHLTARRLDLSRQQAMRNYISGQDARTVCDRSQFQRIVVSGSWAWNINNNLLQRKALPEHREGRHEITVRAHQDKDIERISISIIQDVETHVDICFFLFECRVLSASGVLTTGNSTSCRLALVSSFDYLNERRLGQRARIDPVTLSTGIAPVRGEVLDESQVIVWSKPPEQFLKIQPFALPKSRRAKKAVVEIEAVQIDN